MKYLESALSMLENVKTTRSICNDYVLIRSRKSTVWVWVFKNTIAYAPSLGFGKSKEVQDS